MTGDPNPPSGRPDFGKARVVNLEEVLRKRRADARTKAKAERRKPDFMKPRSKYPFIGRVPHVWLLILDEAEAMPALPLLLAISNQMRVKTKKAVFITATGGPCQWKSGRMSAPRLPQRLQTKRTGPRDRKAGRHQATGPR